MKSINSLLKGLLRSKFTRIVTLLLLLGLTTTASATVYTFFYANNTATVQSPDVRLVKGSDASASCTAYPCATETIAGTYDTATVGISFFAANTGASPIPASYYSNMTIVQNTGSASHSIKSVQIFNIGGTTADLGSITVYFCTTQTEFTASGSPSTSCVGNFAITSTTGGSVSGTFPVTLTAGSKAYIEIAAYAASSASSGSVTFSIAVQWI